MRSIFAILILAVCAATAQATELAVAQSFCNHGAHQVVLQQNVGHYGVQQVQQFAYPQHVVVQRQFVQQPVFVQRRAVVVNSGLGFRRAVVVNNGFNSNVVVVRRGFASPFFGFGFGF
jgi:hypothetical protein